MPHDLEFLQLALAQDALGTIDGCDYVRVDAVWCLPHDGAAPRFYSAANLWEQSPAGRAVVRERYIADLEHALAVRDAKILDLAQQLADRAATPDLAAPAPDAAAAPDTALPCPICPVTMPSRRSLATHMQRAHKQSLITYERQLPPLLLARPAEPTPDMPPEPPRMRAVAALHAAPITTAAAAPAIERVICPDCDKTYKSAASLASHRSIQHPQLIAIPEPPALAELQIATRHWVCMRCGGDAFAPSVGDPDCCMRCAAAA